MQKQNRAGRIALKIATLLLCAVFATTSVLSTTFAKYTTTGESASDSARVAKWGIELTNVRSDATKSWTVEDNDTSITAASTASDNIIAPGTSGYLARFKLTGNPEVSHNVTMNYKVEIPDGYKKLIGQEDYFPILITIGRATYYAPDNVERKEIHRYVSSAGSLDTLIGQVNGETFSENIVPNGWSGSGYAEYYVRWDWFYNADDVPSYIPENVKTALVAYQSTGNDTLLAEAMVLQLGKEEANGSVATLNSALTTAKNALSGTPTATHVTNLEKALATYLGVDARTHSYEATKTYYVKWSDMNNQGLLAMNSYDPAGAGAAHTGYFKVGMNSSRIYAYRSKYTKRDLFYFTKLQSTFPIKAGNKYEMTFNAANYIDAQYAGVVFAIDTSGVPYFFYGGLGGVSQINDSHTNQSNACIEINYKSFNADYGCQHIVTRGTVGYPVDFKTIADDTVGATSKKYGQYKVTYNGVTLQAQYKNSAGNYVNIGSSFTVPSGSYLAVGLESRNDDTDSNGNPTKKERTMILRDVVIKQITTVTAKSVLQGLVNEVQSIVDAHSTDRDFTISATAAITVTQKDPES